MPYGTLTTAAPYWPNKRPLSFDLNDTDWHVVSASGEAYATVALLEADGKRHFGDLGPGGRIGQCLLHSVDSTGAAPGSGVLYKRNAITTPTTAADADNYAGGGDQQVSLDCPFKILWLKMVAGTDLVKSETGY